MKYVLLAILLACGVALGISGAAPALAQEQVLSQPTAPNYSVWERDARRAEDVLDTALASNEGLDVLRTQLAEWREAFLAAQDINRQRIATLRGQIEALGPKPEGEAGVPSEISDRRAALEQQLNEALAPVRAAEEAYTRANGLISQLDTLVRERQAAQVLRLDPTPLNPVLWPDAVSAVGMVGEAAIGEVRNNYVSRSGALRQGVVWTIVLLVVGFVLVFRSGAWIERAVLAWRQSRPDGKAAFRVAAFVASIFGVILPVAGMLTLIYAIESTELTAIVGDKLLSILAVLVTALAAARWLSTQLFPKLTPAYPILSPEAGGQGEGRFYAIMLAVLLSLHLGLGALSETEFLKQLLTRPVQSVLSFPIIAAAGLMLFRLGQILIKAARVGPADDPDAADEQTPRRPNLVIKTFGRAAALVGVAGPVLAAVGYVSAGGQLVFSSVLTLALFALLAVLQRFVRDIYAMVMGDEAKVNALIPVLIGFALVLLSLPILALIWGARSADISETWATVSAGFQIGESRISPTDFLTFALVFAIGYMLTRLVQNTLKTQVLPKTKMDIGGRNAIVSGLGYVGIFLAALMAITTAGIDLSSLAIVAGALSVGIGFGLQTIVSNFVSGIILLVERPISEGDWIEVGGTMGVVRDISVRATRIETFDRRDVIVPNADLISTSVTNWTKGNLTGRIIVPVGVAYGTDTRLVERVLREIAEAHPQVIVKPPPNVFFIGFGADSMDFEIRAILRDVNYVMQAPSEINHEIAKRFAEEGIEIPFAQRDVWLRNPESLPGAKPAPKPRKAKDGA